MSASVWEPGANVVNIDAESTNQSQVFTATADQTLFILTDFTYTVGTDSLAVYRGGQRLIRGVDWTETTSSSFTVLLALAAGETIEAVGVIGSASEASAAAQQYAANAYDAQLAAEAAAASLNPSLFAQKSANLGDLADAAAARTNLGLGSAATQASSAFEPADTDIVKRDQVQVFTAVQKTTVNTDNDLSFDLSAAMDFVCTPTAGGTLTFTGIAAGCKGEILFVNTANYAISKAATVKSDSNFLSKISATGRYIIAYRCLDGTNVDVTVSGALT